MIRRNGFALEHEEFCSGMVAIAVSVADGASRYFAALGCHCPAQSFNLIDAEAQKSLLSVALEEISSTLLGIFSEE